MSDECTCDCHMPGKFIMHMTPCCEICQNCGKRIAIEKYANHMASCVARVQFDYHEVNYKNIETIIISALEFYAKSGDDDGELAKKTIKSVAAIL